MFDFEKSLDEKGPCKIVTAVFAVPMGLNYAESRYMACIMLAGPAV